jgi:hypothetical protein
MQLIITPTGQVRCLYNESIDLTALGRTVIRRASHVEPDNAGQWHADLSPVDGPTLGPFRSRTEALDAERVWLETYELSPDHPERNHSS